MRSRRGRNPLAARAGVAYIDGVHLTRRKVGAILRTMIPLLALVWGALPMHRCYVATLGAPAASLVGAQAAPVAGVECPHHVADEGSPGKLHLPCSELGRVAPDLRPVLVLDIPFARVAWDAHWVDRDLAPLAWSAARRPLDADRWRWRPLHLRHSVLLI